MIDRNLSLELVQDISSLHIKLPNMSNPDVLQVVPRIHVNVSIYSMRIDELKKIITNHFLWSICNDCYDFIRACMMNRVYLFEHMFPIELSWAW